MCIIFSLGVISIPHQLLMVAINSEQIKKKCVLEKEELEPAYL